jgi:thiol-disulfide isomerase/thioredoxin
MPHPAPRRDRLARRPPRRLAACVAVLAVAGSLASAAPPAAAGKGEETVESEIARGNDLLNRRRADEAVRAFKHADKLAGGTSAEALIGLALTYNQLGAWVNAEKAARDALAVSGDDETLRGLSHNVIGLALVARAEDDADELAEAEAAFRAALAAIGEDYPVIGFNLGETLMRQGRDEEAVPLLEAFLATDPRGPNAARARSLLDDPRRARENLVPAFSMVTLDGRYLTPDDFAGRAVLLDFWGTWCPPCREATPALGRLAKRLDGEPFELVGVSNDSSREVLEQYVAEHEMTWTQVWDRTGEVARNSFLVRSYPTYVVLDHEGRVVYRASGWSERMRREIERQVRLAVRAARKAAPDGDG